MKLTQDEKCVLTLLDDAEVDGFEGLAQRYIQLPKKKIAEIVEKLKNLELVEIIFLADEKDLWYFHTGKVNEEMLDDDLRYKKNYGSDKPVLTSSEKLEKKARFH
ncbi:MAG: hypothetical protein V1659_02435 [Candidatus Woesearchaeota archaeon]